MLLYGKTLSGEMDFRKTAQFLMPAVKPPGIKGTYNIYPDHDVGDGKIFRGFSSLVKRISGEPLVLMDGFAGVFFDDLKEKADRILQEDFNIRARWVNTCQFLKPGCEIENMVSPYLGGNDPLFGTRTLLTLEDFFSVPGKMDIEPGRKNSPLIIFGPGACLFSSNGFLVYFDLPKNEIQFRSRAGSVKNHGSGSSSDPKEMYKRFYFVDWIVLNQHKQKILSRIDIIADSQRPDDITWMKGSVFRSSLDTISKGSFRTRPWFEPGAWGGNWIKTMIPGVNKDVQNYAWSFELIAPENGIILSSSGIMLEASFDFLMFRNAPSILGDCHDKFGTNFPIRFDFLDTFDGGNLSVQCHPGTVYMKKNFGEDFTQEEAYYILDCKDDAMVFLGFREDISSQKFREVLVRSSVENTPVNIEEFVLKHPSRKHDFYLIPPGTVHGSGKNNLVLEISTTPYIFTFKMYDWLRPDLDGKPRPLNIDRAMENLCFSRKGGTVTDELICKPVLLKKGKDWKLYHLPTHPVQLYDVRRYHFLTSVESETNKKCMVMSLVEGQSILVETMSGKKRHYNYAETFIIPAIAGRFRITNESDREAIVVMTYIK